MSARPARRRTLVGALLAGVLVVTLAPTPASAATNCGGYPAIPPSNDDVANAKALGNSTALLSGVTCWATKETGEAAHAGTAAAKSVWFKFDTFQGYAARIDVYTAGSDFDTRLAVYQQDDGAPVASNDDASSTNRTSKVSFLRAPLGSDTVIKYRIAIDGYTNGSAQTADGSYIIQWSQPLVAFTSTAHLARAATKIFLDRVPTSAEYTKAQTDYANGHNFQPGFIVHDLAYDPAEAALPVARLYTAVFDRLPDPSGLVYWLNKRKTGTSLTAIAAAMTTSNEFKNTYGSLNNGQFVDLVYQNVLKRAPDASGRSYWVNKLNGGFKRSAMMAQFSDSNEFVTKSRRVMKAAIYWRLGHGSKTDAQLQQMVATYSNDVDYVTFLLEDTGFKNYVAGL